MGWVGAFCDTRREEGMLCLWLWDWEVDMEWGLWMVVMGFDCGL